MNNNLEIEIFLESEKDINFNFKTQICLKSFIDKNRNFDNNSFFWKNKQILKNKNFENIGFVEVFMKFKFCPGLSIALIETNLDNLSSLKNLLEKKENKNNLKKNEIDNLKQDEILEEEEKTLEIKNKKNEKNKDFKNILIKIEKINGIINSEKIFIFYELSKNYFTTDSKKINNSTSILNYNASHYINLQENNKIKFILFDDSEILDKNKNDFLGSFEIDLNLLNDEESIQVFDYLVDEKGDKLDVKIKFIILSYD